MGRSFFPVRCMTSTDLTELQDSNALSMVAFSGMVFPPLTPSSAVITATALASYEDSSNEFVLYPISTRWTHVDPGGDGLGGEAGEDDAVHGADAGGGHHGGHGQRGDGHVDGHHVAALHALTTEGVA